jgi:hypothetical protein
MRTITAEYPGIPRSRVSVIAALTLVLGVLAFIAVIFRD